MAEAPGDDQRLQFGPLPRFLILYGLLYAAFGVASPYLPAFIETRGISTGQIGLVFATGTAVRLLSAPLAGRIADRWRARREVVAACAVGGATAALLYLLVWDFWAILLVSLVQAVALAPLAPLTDALAVVAAHRPRVGFEYGWVRGTGSAAFIVGSIAVGWAIASFGLPSILLWQAALLLGAAAATALVPEITAEVREGPAIEREGARVLWHSNVFCKVVLAAALILGSHGMHDTFAMIRWNAAGIGPQIAGLLWSMAVVAEVVVFFFIGPALVRRLTPSGCIALAALAGAFRWAVAAVTADAIVLAVIQPLHGITFALLHLACMRLIATYVPVELEATAQAIYNTVGVGAATALVMAISGWLFGWLGGAAFAVMSVLCLLAFPVARSLMRETGSASFR